MAEIKTFAQLGIKLKPTKLVGEKVKLHKFLETKIVVHKFVIKASKYPEKSDKCLHLQYSVDNKMYVSFSIAKHLMAILETVPIDALPFSTTITNKNEIYEFE